MTDDASGADGRLDRALDRFGLYGVVTQLRKPAAIVADDAVIERLRAIFVGEGARLIRVADVTPARFPTPLPGPYFVLTKEDELAVKKRLRDLLRSRGVHAEIYGALHDLSPMSSTDVWALEPAGLEAKLESLYCSKSVVIACTPRSGSQFLARTLEEHGVGAPREHVRPGVIELLQPLGAERVGGFRFLPWFASLSHHASRNGVFATKLISHFLNDLEASLQPAEWRLLQDFIARSRLIYLLRSDKLMQALSRDRAKSTKHYHLFDAVKRDDYRRVSERWTYDFQRIFGEVQKLAKEEDYLFSLISQIRPEMDFIFAQYETMDCHKLAQDLRHGLGLTAEARSNALPTNILRDEQTEEFRQRFLQDYAASYHPQSRATHAPLLVSYDPDSKTLKQTVEPDRIGLAS
jgi:LPS sulfotransferase NodH